MYSWPLTRNSSDGVFALPGDGDLGLDVLVELHAGRWRRGSGQGLELGRLLYSPGRRGEGEEQGGRYDARGMIGLLAMPGIVTRGIAATD